MNFKVIVFTSTLLAVISITTAIERTVNMPNQGQNTSTSNQVSSLTALIKALGDQLKGLQDQITDINTNVTNIQNEVSQVKSTLPTETCVGDDKALQWNGTKFVCGTIEVTAAAASTAACASKSVRWLAYNDRTPRYCQTTLPVTPHGISGSRGASSPDQSCGNGYHTSGSVSYTCEDGTFKISKSRCTFTGHVRCQQDRNQRDR